MFYRVRTMCVVFDPANVRKDAVLLALKFSTAEKALMMSSSILNGLLTFEQMTVKANGELWYSNSKKGIYMHSRKFRISTYRQRSEFLPCAVLRLL